MTPKLTDEMRHALQSQPGRPLEVEDAETSQIYMLVTRESFRDAALDELQRELQIGFDQADAGRFVDWDPAHIKAQGRRRLQEAKPA